MVIQLVCPYSILKHTFVLNWRISAFLCLCSLSLLTPDLCINIHHNDAMFRNIYEVKTLLVYFLTMWPQVAVENDQSEDFEVCQIFRKHCVLLSICKQEQKLIYCCL